MDNETPEIPEIQELLKKKSEIPALEPHSLDGKDSQGESLTAALMVECAKCIETIFKEFVKDKIGFVLISFNFDNPGTGNYISNCHRDDVIASLRETADRLENGEVTTVT